MNEKKYHFAYGSNMNSKDLAEHCKKKNRVITLKNPKRAVLQHYKLTFNGFSTTRHGAVADIIPSKGDDVWGVLFETDEDSLKNLDLKEGKGSKYERVFVNVIVFEGEGIENQKLKNEVITYVSSRKEAYDLPHRDYLKVIIEGAKEHGLPTEYIEKLKEIKTKN